MAKQMIPQAYWSQPVDALLADLRSSAHGLSSTTARERLAQFGPNLLEARRRVTALGLLLAQLKSPLVLILVFAAAVSAVVQEWVDAAIVLTVVIGSTILSFAQEYRASTAVARLRARVHVRATVLRDGAQSTIPADEIVPGDVVLLAAGSLIPADGVLLDAKDCFANQAVLTGESFPVQKQPGLAAADASLSERTNCVFMGTSIRSGTAQALIVQTGPQTVFGQIAGRLSLRPPETEFERGIRHFGGLLTQIMLLLVLFVFAINVFLHKPPVDSLLFAIALAVGLSPELLPAILSVTLAKGAQAMAAHGVIVRRLSAIENLGSMDILCTDKTGTLTVGVAQLDGALDPCGQRSDSVARDAYLNAALQTGLRNPLDDAIVAEAQQHARTRSGYQKVDEIPYDFARKRLSVVVCGNDGTPRLICKGALEETLAVCGTVGDDASSKALDEGSRSVIQQRYADWSAQGYRVLGVATRAVPSQPRYSRDDERDLTFVGFLLFFDPPKPGLQQTLVELAGLGVQLKIITGDNQHVALHLAETIGLPVGGVLTGAEIAALHDEALWQRASRTTLFADVDPNQKERIILALRRTGHVVGYMGDGINDAPALYAADVGISVDTAVDVAKEAADFVLLEQDLDVLRAGIAEGRTTFANTLKYIFTTTSANFGNMFSMAGASLFLPFLPLLAKQILLNNFLSDIPGMTIAGDAVDRELVDTPHRWDMRFIRDFMILFGLVSSLFDFLTFGTLIFLIRATPEQFHTGWFVESVLTELAIALVVRTRRPFYRSKPGRLLWRSTLAVAVITLALPYLPFGGLLGFTPLPLAVLLLLLGITLMYVLAAEATKRIFYARLHIERGMS
ncbi:MAG TPA: magnesium-translocating P-type ATPase [Roseiflexaceae bacterium]|nr:magnesium-translocating P-type ATPase [Roseiflexaceae bacterium]